MEPVLWQENGRASALVEKVCYYLTDLWSLPTNYTRRTAGAVENCAASINYCRRPSAIVCDMETRFELLE